MARDFARLFVSLARTAAVSILAPLLQLPMSIETLQPSSASVSQPLRLPPLCKLHSAS
jgi:hypothetical protein